MPRKWLVIAAAVLAVVADISPWTKSQPQAAPAPSGVLVVSGATLIDGTGAAPVPNSVIVIENGKVAAIGPSSKVRIPAGAQVLDAKGKFVIPGLIDGHVHYRSWMGELYLNNGVTTIVDLSNPTDWILGVREAERTGRVKDLPRIFTTGQAVNRAGGNFSPSFSAGFGGGDAGTPAGPIPPGTQQGPEWARNATKALIAKGVDAIKTQSDNLSGEEVKAITDEAHKANIPFLGHVTDVHRYVDNGLDGVVHLWGVSATLMTPENRKKWAEQGAIMNPYAYMEPDKIDPLISYMVQHHTSLMPMLLSEHSGVLPQAREFESQISHMYLDPELRYVPMDAVFGEMNLLRKDRSYSSSAGAFPYVEELDAARLAEAERGFKNAKEFTRRFVKAGGRVFAGTDTPGAATAPGLGIQQEAIVLVDAGLTPMQALQAVTKNNADFFRKSDLVGTLQVGRFGDLDILTGNPLSDIHNIQKMETVIKGGEVLDRKYHRTYHPPFWTDADENSRMPSQDTRPVLGSVTRAPGTGPAGAAATLVVQGTNFTAASLVYINGRPLETSFVTPRELHATLPALPAGGQPAAGPYNVTVRTPWPGGGASDAKPVSLP